MNPQMLISPEFLSQIKQQVAHSLEGVGYAAEVGVIVPVHRRKVVAQVQLLGDHLVDLRLEVPPGFGLTDTTTTDSFLDLNKMFERLG
jgi:hypothetical protein